MTLGGSPKDTATDYLLSNDFRKEQNEVELEKLRQKLAETPRKAPEDVDLSEVQSDVLPRTRLL